MTPEAVSERRIFRCPECGDIEDGGITGASVTCYGKPKARHEAIQMERFVPADRERALEAELKALAEGLDLILSPKLSDEMRNAIRVLRDVAQDASLPSPGAGRVKDSSTRGPL